MIATAGCYLYHWTHSVKQITSNRICAPEAWSRPPKSLSHFKILDALLIFTTGTFEWRPWGMSAQVWTFFLLQNVAVSCKLSEAFLHIGCISVCCFVRSMMLFDLWNSFENRLPASFIQAKILEVGDLLFSLQVLWLPLLLLVLFKWHFQEFVQVDPDLQKRTVSDNWSSFSRSWCGSIA